MHPFYDANRSLLAQPDARTAGLVSMAAYLLFWAAAIPVALRALRRSGLGAPAPDGPDRAVRILRERYARGEVDLDEYLRRREVLDRDVAP